MPQSILVGKGKSERRLLAPMANRHGLITGATGTGKTVTLRVIAEGLSKIGVPVFMADVKGDLAGLARAGADDPKVVQRARDLGIADFSGRASPVDFWDVMAEDGHPVRTTISDMGPLLISRLLNLNETQSGVLSIVFKVADEQGLLLLDLKDLQAMLQNVGQNAKHISTTYGNVSPASIGAIQRGLLALAEQKVDGFFGEPALDIHDLMRVDSAGRGVINILAAEKLVRFPKAYATFLLWLLAELFEKLPEVGDLDKPKLAFFFDEAHLLFDGASPVVLEKIEQMVRLIRSKGVGVYFVTQSPLDVPDTVLGQLGNRVQHALRAFTPRDQKGVRAAAETFRSDGTFDVEHAISQLAVGEALVSLLDESGSPAPVERTLISPPESCLGAIAPGDRQKIIQGSALYGHYEKCIDRESAYEMLKERAEAAASAEPAEKKSPGGRRSMRQTPVESMVVSTARSIGSSIGRQLVRGLMGLLNGRSRRR